MTFEKRSWMMGISCFAPTFPRLQSWAHANSNKTSLAPRLYLPFPCFGFFFSKEAVPPWQPNTLNLILRQHCSRIAFMSRYALKSMIWRVCSTGRTTCRTQPLVVAISDANLLASFSLQARPLVSSADFLVRSLNAHNLSSRNA